MRGTGTDVGYISESGKGLLNVMNKAVCRDGDRQRQKQRDDKNGDIAEMETLAET